MTRMNCLKIVIVNQADIHKFKSVKRDLLVMLDILNDLMMIVWTTKTGNRFNNIII